MKKTTLFNRIEAYGNDNKGSVIVTVLVAFFFVSVLVAIILSTVAVNFKMRAIDRRTKDEFYYAEKAINDIYTGIGQDCSSILGTSYNNVMKHYKNDSGVGYSYDDQEEAYEEFVETYVSIFNNTVWSNRNTRFNNYIVKDTTVKGGSDATARAKLNRIGAIEYYKSTNRNATDLISDLSADIGKVKCIVIKDVSVVSDETAKENVGYVSEVTSDIVINVPWIDFFNLNQTSYDFALSANHGLFFENNSSVEIKGNVFGGTDNYGNIINDKANIHDSADYGGINVIGANVKITDSEYVISGGDINVAKGDFGYGRGNVVKPNTAVKNGQLLIESKSNLNNQIWFENLCVKGDGSTVDLSGSLFAAGDLQVDSDNSTVNIAGSYYGYNYNEGSGTTFSMGNSKKLTTKEAIFKSNSAYKQASMGNTENPAAHSSSIIINGKKDTVNLKNLDSLMLMGGSYINHESEKDKRDRINASKILADPEKANAVSKLRVVDIKNENGINAKLTDTNLAESVALKASQGILYVPTIFLNKSNPTQYASGTGDPFIVDDKITDSNWFGAKYIKPGQANNHKTVKLQEGAASYYAYCYLSFKDGVISNGDTNFDSDLWGLEYKEAYIKEVMQGRPLDTDAGEVEPSAATIKTDIMSIIKVYDSKVEVENSAIDQRIASKGAILEYNSTDLKVIDKTPDMNAFNSYSENLYKRYRLLDTYMEPMKEIPLSSNTNINGIDDQDLLTQGNEMPMARFFWLGGIRNAVNRAVGESSKCLCYDLDGVKLVLITTSVPLELSTLKDSNNKLIFNGKTNAIVLIDGDTEVSGTVDVNGFIASQGSIRVKEGATFNVTYDSAVINKRIGKELAELAENGGYNDDLEAKDNDTSKQWLIYYLLKTDMSSTFKQTSPYKLKCTGNEMKNNLVRAGNKQEKVVGQYRLYQYTGPQGTSSTNPVNTDYTEYIYFDNWKKGQQP